MKEWGTKIPVVVEGAVSAKEARDYLNQLTERLNERLRSDASPGEPVVQFGEAWGVTLGWRTWLRRSR